MRVFGHDGDTLGQHSSFIAIPTQPFALIVLTNGQFGGSLAATAALDAAPAQFAALTPLVGKLGLDTALLAPAGAPTVTLSADDFNAYAGRYDLLIGLAAPLYAQRRYCGSSAHDQNCSHDFTLIDRVLTAICSSPAEKRELLAEIEDKAHRFVNAHWSAILRLANVLCARGYLNESEIRAVLSRAPSVKLNQAGADLAYDLVSQNKLNWSGFSWDSSDDNDLLDEEDEGSKFYLGKPLARANFTTRSPRRAARSTLRLCFRLRNKVASSGNTRRNC
jgi:hypothetical protein